MEPDLWTEFYADEDKAFICPTCGAVVAERSVHAEWHGRE